MGTADGCMPTTRSCSEPGLLSDTVPPIGLPRERNASQGNSIMCSVSGPKSDLGHTGSLGACRMECVARTRGKPPARARRRKSSSSNSDLQRLLSPETEPCPPGSFSRAPGRHRAAPQYTVCRAPVRRAINLLPDGPDSRASRHCVPVGLLIVPPVLNLRSVRGIEAAHTETRIGQ